MGLRRHTLAHWHTGTARSSLLRLRHCWVAANEGGSLQKHTYAIPDSRERCLNVKCKLENSQPKISLWSVLGNLPSVKIVKSRPGLCLKNYNRGGSREPAVPHMQSHTSKITLSLLRGGTGVKPMLRNFVANFANIVAVLSVLPPHKKTRCIFYPI